jgi:RNA polymerase sigma-70 factor (ECF subfamily)
MVATLDPDRELVAAIQAEPAWKGSDGFRLLYSKYKDKVYNISYRITGNPADALDASQETFSILFKKIGEFRFDSKFSSWLYRIAVNSSIDLMRRGASKRLASLDATTDGGSATLVERIESKLSSPEERAGASELEDEVQRAIKQLSPKLRTIVTLRYVEGLSYEEVGEVLRCSIGTVKSRLSRAHAALQKNLSRVLERHYFQ